MPVLMLLVVVALLSLATVVAGRGHIGALADVRLRGTGLVAIALGAQVVVVSVIPGELDGIHAPVHLATYVLLAAFLWLNRAIPGMVLVALGAGANALVIFANAGVMPASPRALAIAGLPPEKPGEFANSAVVDGPALGWLGDIFAVPASWPASNVFSIGDVLIALGLTIGLHCLAASRPAVAVTRVLSGAWFGIGPRGTSRSPRASRTR
jgi:hypothetical protein